MGRMRRKGLAKSEAEIRADTLRRVRLKGRANLTEAAIILECAQPNIRAKAERGDIVTLLIGSLRYVPLDEIERLLHA